uniref:PDZ domain-containing protein n=1 Tax=Rodentolepis nana TaxID=102285 RepID=A0A0R3TCI1_RODNA
LYVEKEPAFIAEETTISEADDTLNQPFSISLLPEDHEYTPIRQNTREQGERSHSENREHTYVDLAFPHPPPRTSSTTPHPGVPSAAETSPRRLQNNNHYQSRSLGRQGGNKHTALPSHIEGTLPEPGKLRTVNITRRITGEPLGITLATENSFLQPPTRSGSFLSLLSRDKTKDDAKGPPRIIIQRILVDSLADRNGKLFPGDEIVEFNGVMVNSLDSVRTAMANSASSSKIQLVVRTPGLGQMKSHLLSRNRPEHKV